MDTQAVDGYIIIYGGVALLILVLRVIQGLCEWAAYRAWKSGKGKSHYFVHWNGSVEVDPERFFKSPKVRRQIEALRKIPLNVPLRD